jgi:hypothetical protein
MEPRVIAWFSCGAASACASKLAVEKYGDRVTIVYCNTLKSEHSDNLRFMRDVERWIGKPIAIIGSLKYKSVDDVFEARKYMSGPKGAPCTVEMKKMPRFEFQQPDDIHIFGYTAEEQKRIDKFEMNNPELTLEWVLRDNNMDKRRCWRELVNAGIEIPDMYQLGYRNNNCIGCVKASSSVYWNMIRDDFPDIFAQRAKQSRRIGAKLVWFKKRRIFLDELPPNVYLGKLENISCGPECGVAANE